MHKYFAIKRLGVCAMLAFVLISMASCKIMSGDSSTATGKPYELVISIDQNLWDGPVGDTLRSVFSQSVKMFNQPEPIYDIMRVNPVALKGIILRHRNILEIVVTPEVKNAVAPVKYDLYSRPQMLVTVAAPDSRTLIEYLTENRAALQTIFEIAERDRSLAGAGSFNEPALEKEILEMYGMEVGIPLGYKKRNRIDGDFLWLSNEQGRSSQGLIIYSYPYHGREDFDLAHLWARRDEFVKRVPGPSDGSHMITADFEPDLKFMRINGRLWAEMRGLWDVAGDYMGGPFVNYTTFDKATNRMVAIDCYVFSPKNPKRNLMRTLEHIIYSIKFPADESVSQSDTTESSSDEPASQSDTTGSYNNNALL